MELMTSCETVHPMTCNQSCLLLALLTLFLSVLFKSLLRLYIMRSLFRLPSLIQVTIHWFFQPASFYSRNVFEVRQFSFWNSRHVGHGNIYSQCFASL